VVTVYGKHGGSAVGYNPTKKADHIIAALNATTTRITELARATAKQLADGAIANRWATIIAAIFEPLLTARAGPQQPLPA
jgi:hypothetical protein